MKIAHLILAHSEPSQLERIINKLAHQDAYFFIHLDQKISQEAFQYLTSMDRVYLIPDRVKVAWGAYSLVQATIIGFQAIVNSGLRIDYINLLSGSDYPLKPANEIHAFFDENKGRNFMGFESVNEQWLEAIPRITQYHLTNYAFPGKYIVQRWINILTPKRKMPDGLIPVGRSQWMSITTEAVQYILQYLNSHPHIVRFFELTWAPDEMIFQTILYNSDFKGSLVNNNLRYIDWAAGNPSPKILDEQDLEKLLASDKLFARKFDSSKSRRVLDMLDEKIQNLK
ncbi:beta-1,6-N-acetylglucosaminyltransferase [Dyadobacter sp. NIV53]|uniref:beta-1,6-N-acetylglucosaminyltransferase n=1 Tax=Dyadobacter sp. NIV53 TaxID=2861765 RepID=UPI001C868795|nr:beta-1,6-N-acetylglucosaminyltransferase [Dyadobacter sp. NIV53]